MTVLICPVRPGDDNPELRYALRSWETNLLLPGGLILMTVGYKPSWLEPDQHIQGNFLPSVSSAVWDNVRRASEFAALDRRFDAALYMNDDFFCLDPMDSVMAVKRDQTLSQHRKTAGGYGWWGMSLDLTASWLSEKGYPCPDSWEVHRPLLASPRAMLDALSQWDGGYGGVIPQWRTVYGTLSEAEAVPVRDVKLNRKITGVGSPWISTSDQSWRLHRQFITTRFQKPSRWERG